jgi:hypothetical protein
MTEDKPIHCDECGQIVGMLSKNAHGSREEIVTGNDANCDYPPVVTCQTPDWLSQGRGELRCWRRCRSNRCKIGASRDHKAPRCPKVTPSERNDAYARYYDPGRNSYYGGYGGYWR